MFNWFYRINFMPETLNYQNRAIAYSVLAHIYDKGTLAHGPLDIFIPIVKMHYLNYIH